MDDDAERQQRAERWAAVKAESLRLLSHRDAPPAPVATRLADDEFSMWAGERPSDPHAIRDWLSRMPAEVATMTAPLPPPQPMPEPRNEHRDLRLQIAELRRVIALRAELEWQGAEIADATGEHTADIENRLVRRLDTLTRRLDAAVEIRKP
jgi:SOS response regulatory protein OraA/RecX